MKIIVGCLAVIGLLVVLLIGGCLGLGYVAIKSLPEIPPYADRPQIERAFSADLKIIEQYLEKGDATLLSQLSSDVYALYDDKDELLKRHDIDSKSHYLSNRAGVGTLRINGQTIHCVTYEVSKGSDDYVVYFLDRQADNKNDQPVGPESNK